jgi:hypothetical protein
MIALDSPLIFLASLIGQWLAAYAGDLLRRRVRPLKVEEREDFDVIRTASLTLLGLIIAFTFSMAVTRYDQRKNYEEEEANAIGTEYARFDLVPADDAAALRAKMRQYLDERIAFYLARDEIKVGNVDEATAKLQAELWSSMVAVTAKQPQNAVTALLVSGMNDVLNSQGYTQAAWWNRIPAAAWALMALIAICCNLLLGYGEHRTSWFALVFPVIVSVAFFLIADIDNPRAGIIRVPPQNLMTASKAMGAN